MQLDGKTIVITGAAQGLGAAMAVALAERGARIALIDLDAKKLDGVRERIEQGGHDARAYRANVADESEISAAYEQIDADFGGLDASIANAGILRDGLLIKAEGTEVTKRLSLADWQAVIDVNLTGVFLCGREAAAHMVTRGTRGAIVNISSISRYGNFGQSNYSAAKGAVASLTVVWAKELARHGIRVNAIAPGFVATEILTSMPPEVLKKVTAGVPAGRLGEPAEIADTVRFVLENDYVNGRVLEIDGGLRI